MKIVKRILIGIAALLLLAAIGIYIFLQTTKTRLLRRTEDARLDF